MWSASAAKVEALKAGAYDYLTKPIYIKEIITRINILLQKRQRARFEEFGEKINQVVFMSATPSPYELEVSHRTASFGSMPGWAKMRP